MEGSVLSDTDFAKWSKDYVLYCNITTHVETDKHQDLLGKKGGAGFPHIVFMDQKGGVMAQHTAPRTVEGFIYTAQSAKETGQMLADLAKKAAGGDAKAKKDYFMRRFELGHFSVSEATDAIKGLDLSEEEMTTVNRRLAALEIQEVLQDVTEDEATQIRAGKRFYEMAKVGRIPDDMGMGQPFWILMFSYAESEKNVETYEYALAGLKELFSDMMDNPSVKAFIDGKETALAELKKGSGPSQE